MPSVPAPVFAEFNRMSLVEFREFFGSLAAPTPASLLGAYRAAFVGPGWVRFMAGPALALTGLGGWWGKEFLADGTAVNLVVSDGKLVRRFPMELINAPSLIDRKPGLSLRYRTGSPFPWMFVVDELRRVDSSTLLGMTLVDVRGLRSTAFPFILKKSEKIV